MSRLIFRILFGCWFLAAIWIYFPKTRVSPELIDDFDPWSETLIENVAHNRAVHGPEYGGFLIRNRPRQDLNKFSFVENGNRPYLSCAGIQGWVLQAMAPGSEARAIEWIQDMRRIFAIALVLLLGLTCWCAWRQFGLPAAIASMVLFLSASTLISAAPNLYWALFLAWLPFTFSWWAVVKGFRVDSPGVAGALTLLFFLRFLCGYEYITTIALSSAVPFVAVAAQRAAPWPEIRRILISCLGAGFLAFVAAICLHVWQGARYTGSLGAIAAHVEDRAHERTSKRVADPDFLRRMEERHPTAFRATDFLLGISRARGTRIEDYLYQLSVYARMLATPLYRIPFVRLPIPLGLMMLVTVLGFLFTRRSASGISLTPSAIFAASALIASASWSLLARNHDLSEWPLTTMHWYLPFGSGFAVLLGGIGSTVVARAVGNRNSQID